MRALRSIQVPDAANHRLRAKLAGVRFSRIAQVPPVQLC